MREMGYCDCGGHRYQAIQVVDYLVVCILSELLLDLCSMGGRAWDCCPSLTSLVAYPVEPSAGR